MGSNLKGTRKEPYDYSPNKTQDTRFCPAIEETRLRRYAAMCTSSSSAGESLNTLVTLESSMGTTTMEEIYDEADSDTSVCFAVPQRVVISSVAEDEHNDSPVEAISQYKLCFVEDFPQKSEDSETRYKQPNKGAQVEPTGIVLSPYQESWEISSIEVSHDDIKADCGNHEEGQPKLLGQVERVADGALASGIGSVHAAVEHMATYITAS